VQTGHACYIKRMNPVASRPMKLKNDAQNRAGGMSARAHVSLSQTWSAVRYSTWRRKSAPRQETQGVLVPVSFDRAEPATGFFVVGRQWKQCGRSHRRSLKPTSTCQRHIAKRRAHCGAVYRPFHSGFSSDGSSVFWVGWQGAEPYIEESEIDFFRIPLSEILAGGG
jgi:hypothetical protein